MTDKTSKLSIDIKRLRHDFDALAQIGATPAGGITRQALSNEDLQARNWFADRIESGGFFVNDD
ncbi:MAG: Zn-dependent hydrolase, partial [Aggregatilineales bacterium]